MSTADRLAEIKARTEVATEGPWIVDPDDDSVVMHPDRGHPDGFDGVAIARIVDHDAGMFPREHNGQFIAHAREDVPALVTALGAVLRAHRPEPFYDEPRYSFCRTCQRGGTWGVWPCATVRVIEKRLGGAP